MATLYVDGKETEDTWLTIDGEQPVPNDGNIIVSLEVLQANSKNSFEARTGKLGVFLTADEQITAVTERMDELDLIALDFPSFADGRAFSKATLLRADHSYKGEVRAVGDVRIDQVAFMKRCGFDALLIRHQPTIDALNKGDDPSLHLYYQPAIGDSAQPVAQKAWARRAEKA